MIDKGTEADALYDAANPNLPPCWQDSILPCARSVTPRLQVHLEHEVAHKRTARRRDLYRSAGGADGHLDLDFSSRVHCETGFRAVKSYARDTCQIRSNNKDAGTNFAGAGQQFHERSEAHGELENRAILVSAADPGCAIQVAVGSLQQPAGWVGAVGRIKAVKSRQRTRGGHLEDSAKATSAAFIRCAVEIPVSGLN